MKKALISLSVFMLTLSMAWGNGLGFFGSYWDTDDAEDGFGGGLKVALQLVPNLNIEGRGTYFPDFGDADDMDLAILIAEGGGVVTFPMATEFLPYVGGGVGYYSFDPEADDDLIDVDIDDEIGYYGVAGMEIGTGNAVVLIEGIYRSVEATAEAEALGVRVEDTGDLDGFGGNVGFVLKW